MKVLFICLDHYPHSGACTSLLNKMLYTGGLKEKLGEVHVLTVKRNYADADYVCINGVKVHRCYPLSLLTRAEILRILPQKPWLALRGIAIKLVTKVRNRLCKKELIFRRNVTNAFIKKLQKLKNENYDILIPISGYYEAAAVAMESDIPVVLYQVDPCASNAKFARKIYKEVARFEKRLYEAAAAIITTPIIYREICENYPEQIVKKTHAMEFPNVDAEDTLGSKRERTDIRCLFAGSLYPTARNPRYTVKLFNGIQNSQIRLVFVGADKEQMREFVEEKQIAGNMSFLGKLPLEKAQEEIADADILVNIGNIMTNQVPSKIFEYISSGKPIINICVNQNCPSIPYLEKYPLALSIVEGVGTPEEHSAQIEKFIIENAGRTVDKAIILERFKECTAEYCARQMTHVLTNVNYK